jgi:hypothetical protein
MITRNWNFAALFRTSLSPKLNRLECCVSYEVPDVEQDVHDAVAQPDGENQRFPGQLQPSDRPPLG